MDIEVSRVVCETDGITLTLDVANNSDWLYLTWRHQASGEMFNHALHRLRDVPEFVATLRTADFACFEKDDLSDNSTEVRLQVDRRGRMAWFEIGPCDDEPWDLTVGVDTLDRLAESIEDSSRRMGSATFTKASKRKPAPLPADDEVGEHYGYERLVAVPPGNGLAMVGLAVSSFWALGATALLLFGHFAASPDPETPEALKAEAHRELDEARAIRATAEEEYEKARLFRERELHRVIPGLERCAAGVNEVHVGLLRSFTLAGHDVSLTFENRATSNRRPDVTIYFFNDYGFVTDSIQVSWLFSSVKPGETRVEQRRISPRHGEPVYFSVEVE